MAQWLSQTRKINRHYQSNGKKEGEIYIFNRKGARIYVDSVNPEGEIVGQITFGIDERGTRIHLNGRMKYFNDQEFKWEDHVNNLLWVKQYPADKVERGITIQIPDKYKDLIRETETKANRITYYFNNNWQKDENLFNATTQEPEIDPINNSIKSFIIVESEIVHEKEGDEWKDRIYGVYIDGIEGPYPYVNYMLKRWNWGITYFAV